MSDQGKKRRNVKGSMTVEAALILPLVFAMFGLAMVSGLRICEECKATAIRIREEQEPDIVKEFYIWKELGEKTGYGDTVY